ncbi:MAG TPA: hypothetical protein VFO60_03935 [Candidatus Dormibacteraeota bacterium]|nr:hypothetical protein [Candidatus Dormibacteraeota bacterium]
MPRAARRRAPSSPSTIGLAAAIETFVDRVAELVEEVRNLEAENETLRSAGAARVERLAKQVETLKERNASLRARPAAAPRRARSVRAAAPKAAPAARGSGRRAASASAAGPKRPAAVGVTAEVVRAVIGKLGTPTAAEIAAEIKRAGAPVSGRAVRFIAEHLGAVPFRDGDGVRRYKLG